MADFGKRTGLRAAAGLLQNLLERRRERAAEKDRSRGEPPETP
jgi:hypothetical protein